MCYAVAAEPMRLENKIFPEMGVVRGAEEKKRETEVYRGRLKLLWREKLARHEKAEARDRIFLFLSFLPFFLRIYTFFGNKVSREKERKSRKAEIFLSIFSLIEI